MVVDWWKVGGIIAGILFSCALLAAEEPAIDFEAHLQPDALESFQLISVYKQEDEAEEEAEVDPDAPNDPSLLWRILGYGSYTACAMQSTSVLYRESRSSWSAPVSNAPANFSIMQGIAIGLNILSEKMRQDGRNDWAAAVVRIGAVGGCSYTTVNNYYQGWRRR